MGQRLSTDKILGLFERHCVRVVDDLHLLRGESNRRVALTLPVWAGITRDLQETFGEGKRKTLESNERFDLIGNAGLFRSGPALAPIAKWLRRRSPKPLSSVRSRLGVIWQNKVVRQC